MSLTLVAVIAAVWSFVGVFALALCKMAGRRPPAPPARPRARKLEIDLDDVKWEWRS